MANTIDLAQYKYTLSLDSSGYNKGMNEAEQTAENMKTKLNGVGSFLKGTLVTGLVAAGAAIAGTIVEGVKSYADLEQQMASFKATTGASADEVAKVQDIAQQLYKTNTDSMEDIVATSAAMKTQLGATSDQIGALQQTIMDFAKTTGMANIDVVSSVDDIGDAWGMTAEESVGYLDVIKRSSEEYGTDVASVTSALSQAAPAAKALGLSLDETNGVMNMFAASGLDSSQAITAFTYAAKQVKSPEEFKTMLADVQAIADPTARAQKAVELFGSRAGVALSNAFNGNKSLEDFVLTTEECAGAVTDAGDAFDNNFNVQLELAKKQFSGLAMEIGEKLMPTINSVLSWVTSYMPAITSAIEGAISFIGSILQPFIDVIKTVFSSFKGGSEETNTAFTAIKNVITSVITAIQTIIKAFVNLFNAIWSKWGDDITSYVTTAWNGISAIIGSVTKIIKGIIDTFTALVNGDWQGFLNGLLSIASGVWDLIKNLFTTVLDLLTTILRVAFEAMKTVVTTIFTAIWNVLKSIFTSIQQWFENAWNGLVTWLSGLASNFYNAATTLFSSLWEGLKSIWTSVTSWFSEIFNGVVTTITGFAVQLYDAGVSIFTSLWDGIKSVWESISSWVSEKVSWIAEKLVFWKSSQAEMSSGSGGTTVVDGSHANGLAYVPFDGYVALLHRGERVLTAAQNAGYGGNTTSSSTNNTTDNSIRVEHMDVHPQTFDFEKTMKEVRLIKR